jgi:hypothetical protein
MNKSSAKSLVVACFEQDFHVFFYRHIIKDPMSSSITIVNERLTFSGLVGAMERGGAIKEVILEDVVIEGDEDAMRLLTRYFRGHYSIEKAVFRRVHLADERNDLGIIFSTLLVSACELKHFHVEECPVSSAVLICVSYSPNLESLRLISCNLGDADATKLVDVLAKATSVTVLDVSGNGFSAIGESALKTGLERSTSISSLMINGQDVVLAKAPQVKAVLTKQISAQTA